MSTAIVVADDPARIGRALAQAERAVVVLGSAFDARMAKAPFTWEERAAMIRLCIAEADRERVRFVPVRSYFDHERWVAAVQAAVAPHLEGPARPMEEESSPIVGRPQCEIYLRASDGLEAALAMLAQELPAAVVDYLRAWAASPFYAELAADQRAIDAEKAKWRGAPYEPLFITVDAVVRAADRVLLVKRGARPNRGTWALPGGFLDPHERLLDGALRELREETRLGLPETVLRQALQRVVVFDDPNRSQRGRTVTHAHYFDLRVDSLPEVHGSDDAADARWISIAELAGMEAQFFEDHFHILDEFFRLT